MTTALEWREMIQRSKAEARAKDDDENAEPTTSEPIILETGIPLGKLPRTPNTVWNKAAAAGFQLEGYESRTLIPATYYASDSKSGKKKGDLKKDAFEQRNIFIGGHVPAVKLIFHAAWLGTTTAGFSARIWDPVGRYRYADSRDENDRETFWMEKSSRAFLTWIAEWDTMLADLKGQIQP